LVSEAEADKKDLDPDEFAKSQAELWKAGLAEWDEDADRIKRSRNGDFVVYTPGSNAGLPVSILKSFAAPPQVIRDDQEALRDRVNTTATSILAWWGVGRPGEDASTSSFQLVPYGVVGSQDLDLPASYSRS